MKAANRRKLPQELVLIVVTLLFILPLYYAVINAFKSQENVSLHPFTIWFDTFTLKYIRDFFINRQYLRTLFYSGSITVLAVVMIISLCSLGAFPLANVRSRIFRVYYFAIIGAIVLPFEIALIPLVIVLKNLHLSYTVWGIALVHTAWNAPFAIFLYTGYMRRIPRELEEAAIIDGCGMFRTYYHIYLPLIKPITAACIIIFATWVWNDFLVAYVALRNPQQLTMQVNLYSSLGKYLQQYNVLFAGMILVCLPILVLFLFMQKHFIKGLTAGAIKG
jgi:raffinose/stachyose/melibiose transport system permease protein